MESQVLKGSLVLLAFFLTSALTAQVNFWTDLPEDELIESILSRISDEELLGQVFMLGYTGHEPSAQIARWIEKRNLGGVKIFSRNVDTLPSLARSIKKMQMINAKSRLRIPLLVATDQEGGWVLHIKGKTSLTPGNMALGAGGLPRDAFLTGLYIGRELKLLGINMNFAPTIDIYSNPEANVIGPRAFSSDAKATAMLALAYFKGMARSGIISTAKHYPGHGNADRDSHGMLPVIDISFQEMWDRELVPYRILIREGLPAIMSGHLAYPKILGDLTPSSRSPYFINELLRRKLGFEGLLVTDDMEMNGVLNGEMNTSQASRAALEAGNDMILISHTPHIQNMAWNELLDLIKRDRAFKNRIETSVRRILQLKIRTFKGENPFPIYPDEEVIASNIPAEEARQFFKESSLRSVTLFKKSGIPFKPGPEENILLIGQFREFLEEGMLRYPGASSLYFPYAPFYSAGAGYKSSIPEQASRFDTIIFCLANYNSLEILKELEKLGKKVIVISTLTPVYLRETPWVESSLAVYGTGRNSFKAGFAALAGDFIPEGKSPLDFISLDEPPGGAG